MRIPIHRLAGWLAWPLLTLMLAAPAAAAPFSHTWLARELARGSGEQAELRDAKGRLLKRIEMRQLLYIYAAMQAIREAAEIEAELFIVDGDQPNAFATVGKFRPKTEEEAAAAPADRRVGTPVSAEEPPDDGNSIEINVVGINFAMLDMLATDVDMVAALIGHELAHLKLKHGEDPKQQHRTQVSMQTAAATKYSRDNEREADYLGTVWAVEAGYDPQGAVRLQELLYQHTRFKGGAFVGSHPSSTERIAILKSLARRLSGQEH